MNDGLPAIDLGGVTVRVRTSDARTRAIVRGNFRRWRRTDGGPLELDLARVPRLPAAGRARRGATWTAGDGGHAIVSPWFRLAFDAAGRRGAAAVLARFGMADFCRPLAGALLAARGGFLLHAATLEAPGGGVLLFTGPSGYGKTTLAKSVPRRVVLGDDSCGIRMAPGPGTGRVAVLAHPTPFFGDYGKAPANLRPGPRPVRALFLLEKPSRETRAHAVSPATAGEAAARVLTQILMAKEAPPGMRAALLGRAVAFASAVPVYRFRYVPGPTVWDFLATWVTAGAGRA